MVAARKLNWSRIVAAAAAVASKQMNYFLQMFRSVGALQPSELARHGSYKLNVLNAVAQGYLHCKFQPKQTDNSSGHQKLDNVITFQL